MKRFLKLAGIAIVGLLVIAIIALKLISDNQYKEWIVSAVTSATGRDFSIETLELDFNSEVAIRTTGIALANAEWGETPKMAVIDRLDAKLSLFSLLRRIAEINVTIEKADLHVETNAQGEHNWVMRPRDSETKDHDRDSQKSGLPLIPLIREFKISDATIHFSNNPDSPNRLTKINELLIQTPDKNSSISLSGQIEGDPVNITGDLGNIQRVIEESADTIKLNGEFAENTLDIAGEWGPLAPSPNMNLKLDLSVLSPSRLGSAAGIAIGDIGTLKMNADLSAIDGIFSLTRILTNLDGEIAQASVEGSIADLVNLDGMNLAVVADTKTLNELLSRMGIEVPIDLPPDVSLKAQVNGIAPLNVRDLNAEIRDQGVEILVTSTPGETSEPGSNAAQFSIKADALSSLSKYAQIDLPNLGAVAANGNIVSEDGAIKLDGIEAKLISDNINLNITGNIADALTVKGLDLNLDADIQSLTPQNLSEIETLLGQLKVEIPISMLPSGIQIKTNVHGDLENLGLDAIDAVISDNNLQLNLSGAVADITGPGGVDANFTLESASLAAFSKYTGFELPDSGVLDLSGHIKSNGELLTLEGLDATLKQDGVDVTLTASVADLLTINGINATAKANIDSLEALSGFSNTTLPKTDPITIEAQINNRGDTKDTEFLIDAQSAGATAKLQGILSDITAPETMEAEITLASTTIKSFEGFAQTELPDNGPFSLNGVVQVSKGEYSLNNFVLVLGDQTVNGYIGMVAGEADGALSTLKGELNIPYLDLTPFLLGDPADESTPDEAADQTRNTASSASGAKKQSGVSDPVSEPEASTPEATEEPEAAEEKESEDYPRLFSAEPFPLDQFRQFDIDISVTANRLVLGKTDMRDFSMPIIMKEGRLTINPIKAVAGKGNMNGNVVFDARTDNPNFSLDLTLVDIPMPRLGGKFSFNAKLNGDGESPATIASGLDGQLLVVVKDGMVPRNAISNLGTGLFSFSEDKAEKTLECGILRIDVNDGLADFDKKLAVQFEDVTWSGGGEIDFKTEKLGIGIVPKPRKGLGISAGMLASLVYVGGTLKNPKPSLNPTDVAIQYSKYLAFLSTGGLSLLAEAMINKSQANTDVCTRISDGTVFDETEETDSNQSPESSPEQEPESVDAPEKQPENPPAEEDNKP